jgi:hypothetical protein
MTVGNLVRVTRAMIGVPIGSLGLLVEKTGATYADQIEIWVVKFICREHTRRLLGRDLEVVSS